MLNQEELWQWFRQQAGLLGLECLGVSDTNLKACEPHLSAWLDAGMHGEMGYMARHGMDRLNPDILLPGTVSIVSFRFNYTPASVFEDRTASIAMKNMLDTATAGDQPYVSVYARGRDYHKVIRAKLAALAKVVHARFESHGFRVSCDSAPAPEVEIARKAGLGWRGKHTLLIHPSEGSLFFLGEIFTNLPLPPSTPFGQNHCGQCTRCISACPTRAIVEPYKVDARRCISYLTIEHDSAIPLEFRKAIGTRIYGCDDCQLVCPWNKFAKPSVYADFEPRHGFDKPEWQTLMGWTEEEFNKNTEGMAIRRIGYRRFRRNLAIAAGNSCQKENALRGLQEMHRTADAFLREHIDWAIRQQEP